MRTDSKQISGTIYGAYDYSFEGKGAWVGHVIFNIDGQPVKGTFVDRNNSLERKPDGAIGGTETITVTFSPEDSFDVCATFTGTPASTPGLYTLNESGKISHGTGAYRNISGTIDVKGPFLLPDPNSTPGAPPWIAEIHGVLTKV